MLKPDDAAAQLASSADQNAINRRVERVLKLPLTVRKVGLSLLAYDDSGNRSSEWGDRSWMVHVRGFADSDLPLCEEIETWSQNLRTVLFSALFPRLGPQIDSAWTLIPELPYQSDWRRRPFRAPTAPYLYREQRSKLLNCLITLLNDYEPDMVWLASWAPYLGGGKHSDILGILFAAAINRGDAEAQSVFDVLMASARAEHESGAMGRHVIRGLLCASKPDGWEFIESCLLNAQRDEGIRQAILETVDEAHPDAFRNVLRLILDHNLCRFSSVVRAVDVWIDAGFSVDNVNQVESTLTDLMQFLTDTAARKSAINTAHGLTLYLALFADGYCDAIGLQQTALNLLADPDAGRRFIGLHMVVSLKLRVPFPGPPAPDSANSDSSGPTTQGSHTALDNAVKAIEFVARFALRAFDRTSHRVPGSRLLPTRQSGLSLLDAVEDTDIRNAAYAVNHVLKLQIVPDNFDWVALFDKYIARLPAAGVEFSSSVWPHTTIASSAFQARYGLIRFLGDRSPRELLKYINDQDSQIREYAVRELCESNLMDEDIRTTLLRLTADRAVQEYLIGWFTRHGIRSAEAHAFEKPLGDKSPVVRQLASDAMLTLPDDDVLPCIERQLLTPETFRHQSALAVAVEMINHSRGVARCVELIEQFAKDRSLSDAEKVLIESIIDPSTSAYSGFSLGLYKVEDLTPAPSVSLTSAVFVSQAAINCLASLHGLIASKRSAQVVLERRDGTTYQVVFGTMEDHFWLSPWAFWKEMPTVEQMPLHDVWENWWQNRPESMRDPDGLELIRLHAGLGLSQFPGMSSSYEPATGNRGLVYRARIWPSTVWEFHNRVRNIVEWLLYLHPPAGAADLALDGVEADLCICSDYKRYLAEPLDLRNAAIVLMRWHDAADRYWRLRPDEWTAAQIRRYWKLSMFRIDNSRHPVTDTLAFAAFEISAATEADVLAALRERRNLDGESDLKNALKYPFITEMIDRIRNRIVEVECRRGEAASNASTQAGELSYSGGMETLFRLIVASRGIEFVRTREFGSQRSYTLCHLMRVTKPGANDTPEQFALLAADADIPHVRFLELAMLAPQWSRYIESALEWPGLRDAVAWVHLHKKEDLDYRPAANMSEWIRSVMECTELSEDDLRDGCVDIDWFRTIYSDLGADRWAKICTAAKFASGSHGYKRAQLYADTMLGKVKLHDLLDRIAAKRDKDSVKALGLVPLAGADDGKSDLSQRYIVLQEFLRTSRQFGAKRRETEGIAVRAGMYNLAHPGGVDDPVQLQWEMEEEATADLAAGPISATAGGVTVTLTITEFGKPELEVEKNGKRLASVPASVKKDPGITALAERTTTITQQASRMRESLQQSMCSSDTLSARYLQSMLKHPVLAPMARSLVFISETSSGYPIEDGSKLQHWDGSIQAIGDRIRIAHPWDLLRSGNWAEWQRDCFTRELIQPFKQVFRELYILTEAEAESETHTNRYAGHQVKQRRAAGVLRGRGWTNEFREGIRRTFHSEKISAWLDLSVDYGTPAEVESPIVQQICFAGARSGLLIPLKAVPSRLFSETMRDIDLLVSVAHAGGVDPEASASTTEMRARLVEEAARLLKLNNVRLNGVHVMVDGTLSTYSIHLGSAVVHRQPGGHLCIVAVPGHHRGRLFLPFADDDPRTAEVVSKVILLAKDQEIKDPVILEQILRP